MTTGIETTPKSASYHPFLISRLKEPEYAAAYIEAFFEEKDPEPELLEVVLGNVAEALGEAHLSPEQAKQHREQLAKLLSLQGSDAVYRLALWLEVLGLRLSITAVSHGELVGR